MTVRTARSELNGIPNPAVPTSAHDEPLIVEFNAQ